MYLSVCERLSVCVYNSVSVSVCLDEMYQVVVYMPEDVPFNCRVCYPQRPSPWQTAVQQEMYSGMSEVLDVLISSHSSVLLQPITHTVSTDCTCVSCGGRIGRILGYKISTT